MADESLLREVRMRTIARGALAGIMALSPVGCASGGLSQPTAAYGALSAEAAVGQFLDAAVRSDYRVMARLFGSADGPAEQSMGRVEVEQRMYVLASLLLHRSYSLRPMDVAMEAGSERIMAQMVGTRNGDVTVPFIATNYRGRWFVERIVTDPLTPRD